MAHYGLVLKLEGDLTNCVDFLKRGIESNMEGTQVGEFYFHLGDALQRLRHDEEADEVYGIAVQKGLFLSKSQRSLYNIRRLKSRPWWTHEQTTYGNFFRLFEDNWKVIRDEALHLLSTKNKLFHDESEQLREFGDWKQLELYSRGIKSLYCEQAPVTCQLIGKFKAASTCRRGQVKFSVMQPGTHVWPHCGPTNCRLRAHLGLVIPQNVRMRVGQETRTWNEGKVLIFDDSFEHEVWHNGTSMRIVLIIDVWHPELSYYERSTMNAI